MDVFIPLGGPQNNNFLELRYTLRSLERYMIDLDRVFIAGERLDWLVGVEYLSVYDDFADPRGSVQKKLLAFCKVEDASDDFLFTHDDIIARVFFSGEKLPFFGNTSGVGSIVFPQDFSVHTPVRYNRKMYAELFSNPDNNKVDSPRSFYLNFYGAVAEKCDDVVLRLGHPNVSPEKDILRAPFFTLNDRVAGTDAFLSFMDSLFPDPSRFEV